MQPTRLNVSVNEVTLVQVFSRFKDALQDRAALLVGQRQVYTSRQECTRDTRLNAALQQVAQTAPGEQLHPYI